MTQNPQIHKPYNDTKLRAFRYLLTPYNITMYQNINIPFESFVHLSSLDVTLTLYYDFHTIILSFQYNWQPSNGSENMHDFILCPHGLHKKQIQCNLHTYALFYFGCICGRSSIKNMEKTNTHNTSIREMQFLFTQDKD